MKIIKRLITCFILIASAAFAQDDLKVVAVNAEGVGSTVAEAAQNAAQNALTNVVGSFMDAKKILEKRTEINNGIRNETTSIRTDIKEYSQGSIRSFEIIGVNNSNGLVRVTIKRVVIEAYGDFIITLHVISPFSCSE